MSGDNRYWDTKPRKNIHKKNCNVKGRAAFEKRHAHCISAAPINLHNGKIYFENR